MTEYDKHGYCRLIGWIVLMLFVIPVAVGFLTDWGHVTLQQPSDFFPPTATNIVSVDGTWYTFILDDTVWYVRELKGKPVYLRGPAE